MIRLTGEPLDIGAAAAAVADPAAGGIAVFAGVTRSEKRNDRALLALDYDAYADMAIKQFRDLADQAAEKWPVLKCLIWHRTGRVAIGEPSVLIAVSTPHRAEAFVACQWLIDQLKLQAAVWKQEVWSDGSSTWVHPDL